MALNLRGFWDGITEISLHLTIPEADLLVANELESTRINRSKYDCNQLAT